jgi:hypothetical protein
MRLRLRHHNQIRYLVRLDLLIVIFLVLGMFCQFSLSCWTGPLFGMLFLACSKLTMLYCQRAGTTPVVLVAYPACNCTWKHGVT